MGARAFTIASHRPFLESFAAHLYDAAGPDRLALAGTLVLLPTRRACRALEEAFLRVADGAATLLPRMMPVGDLDAAADEVAEAAIDLPPAIPALRRRLLLARLIGDWGAERGRDRLLPAQAAALADALSVLLDEAAAERVPLDRARLAALVPEELSHHWQEVVAFLDIVVERWPRHLAGEGALDPGQHRNEALTAQIDRWRDRPPQRPVWAAGLTASLPVVADVVAAVLALPQGGLVLPGLDRHVDPELWQAIAETPGHPHHAMGLLLTRLGIEPGGLAEWPATPRVRTGAAPERAVFVREVLRPAATTALWRESRPPAPAALAGLRRIDCATPAEEAATVALLMRERLETPGETAALVTPDRDLARRVAAELRRWDIEIDDSAGTRLNRTPPGVFLRLVGEAAASDLAPVPLLALLKHPLAAAGRDEARHLDEALRGTRPAPGADALFRAAGTGPARAAAERAVGALAPLLALFAHGAPAEIGAFTEAHARAAEALAATEREAGALRVWAGEAGEAAARFMAELIGAAHDTDPVRPEDWPPLFETLLAGAPTVRPRYGRHPRLFIWGLLEARLQAADLTILGGLNEGTWPAEAPADPWISRPMRRDAGLPVPERRLGQAAHDFAMALEGGREVVMTRAARVGGAPTVPSRWLVRLDAVLEARGLRLDTRFGEARRAWAGALDQPVGERRPAEPPAPTPPVAVRPRRLSVTAVETWMRDPYGVYARHILKLKEWEALDAAPDAADRGSVVHKALERFVAAHPPPAPLPPDAAARLRRAGEEAFGPTLDRPGIWAFWWPRFERIAAWFLEMEATRRPGLRASLTERKGTLLLPGRAGPFTLTATADRIDVLTTGELVIIDYKTGAPPTGPAIKSGLAAQLPLEAAIARAGGFAGLAAADVAALEHWQLQGLAIAGKVKPVAGAPGALADAAVAGLTALVERFDHESTAYRARPRPEAAPRHSAYKHLARWKEWALDAEHDG